MAQSYLRNPSIERLPVILEELHRGSLCIPPFQRDFEWEGPQRLALFSSVRMGLPTGALMVWRTGHELKSEDPIGPYSLAETRVAASQYLLDGRQRMTTLYAALAPSFWTREGKPPPLLTESNRNAPDGTPWRIVFDLDRNDGDASSFIYEEDEEPPQQEEFRFRKRPLLPLSVLLDDNAYDEWRGRNTLSREQTNRARALRSAFIDYLIPVVPLVTDEIPVVTLTFKRVNSGGTPMGDADMTRVLAWSKGFDLRDHINRILEELNPHGWGSLDRDTLHKVIAVVSTLEPTEVDPEALAKKIEHNPSLVETAGKRVLMVARGTANVGMLLADGAEGLPAPLRRSLATDKRLKVALRSPANRIVCPPEELPKLRVALLQSDCPEDMRRSHLVEADAHAALLDGKLEEFFECRRGAIVDAEKRWVEELGGEVDFLRESRKYTDG